MSNTGTMPVGDISEKSGLTATEAPVSLAPDTEAKSSDQNETANSDAAALAAPKLYTVLAGLTLVTLMLALDITVVATAIPRITDHFGTIKDVGWYGAAYIMCNSALQPSSGKVFTYFPLTESYLIFVAVFEIGSLLCALATSSTMLIVGRAVAGIGGSGLMNGAMTMIGVAATPNQRPMLLAIIMAMFGCGQILGPIVGGVLTQHASWRWCFWINLPIGACAAITLFIIKIPNPNRKRGVLTVKTFFDVFDITGLLLFAPASVMMLLALEWGGVVHAWKSATIIGLLCGGSLTFVIFIVWEYRKGESAMFPGSIIGQRVIWSGCLTAGLNAGSTIMMGYYLPLWFQAVQRDSPTASAIHILPSFVSQIVSSILAGVLVTKVIGYFTPFSVLGAILVAIGSGLMTTFTPTSGIGEWFGYQIFLGIGRGIGMQQALSAVQASVTGAQMATGMAIVAWAQLFGGALVVALAQTTFTNLLRTALPKYVPELDPTAVIGAGATNYLSLATNSNQETGLVLAYNQAVTRTYFLALGCAIGATLTSFGLGWKKVAKKEKKEKDKEKVDVSEEVQITK